MSGTDELHEGDTLVPLHRHDTRHRRHILHLATGLNVTVAAARFKAGGRRRIARQEELVKYAPSPSEAVARLAALCVLGYALALAAGVLAAEGGALAGPASAPGPAAVLLSAATFGAVDVAALRASDTAPVCGGGATAPHVAVLAVLLFAVMHGVYAAGVAVARAAGSRFSHKGWKGSVASLHTLATAVSIIAVVLAYSYPLFPLPESGEAGTCSLGSLTRSPLALVVLLSLAAVYIGLVVLVTDPLHRLGLAGMFAKTRETDDNVPHMAGYLLFPVLIGPLIALLGTAVTHLTAARLALVLAYLAFSITAEAFSFPAYVAIMEQIAAEIKDLGW